MFVFSSIVYSVNHVKPSKRCVASPFLKWKTSFTAINFHASEVYFFVMRGKQILRSVKTWLTENSKILCSDMNTVCFSSNTDREIEWIQIITCFFIYKEKQNPNVETTTALHLAPTKGTVVYKMSAHHSVYKSSALYYLLYCFKLYELQSTLDYTHFSLYQWKFVSLNLRKPY